MLSCSLAATMRAVAADEVGGRLGSEPVAGLKSEWVANLRRNPHALLYGLRNSIKSCLPKPFNSFFSQALNR
jgi:hypothetical protein